MTRKTVTIRMPDDGNEPRDFHLFEHKVARFVAKIAVEGGTATIGPYSPSPELLAMLRRAGVTQGAAS